MPTFTEADTIRILVATDNHVGYNERDATRGDDSWQAFHEIMCLARERDVDMVLLAGDLFHENKPSRKSMYQVMRSLRMNCYGEKPCELEMLSDASENFDGAFNHVNYEDPDINVAIPVFSIHGNHDDPSGEGHLAALDILQTAGLLNYYGRTPESDNILIKPVLLQKGQTKLALYGMSNVRDERLFRTFRDGNVKFFQPTAQKDDWFNLMSVHQNHHAYTDTGYLPEHFLPSFLDLIVWGHEHECIINPRTNPEANFRVMQPGSSVATSLVPGEAVQKQVAILTIKGKKFESEPIPLKSVRPFIYHEIALSDDRKMREIAFESENRLKVTKYLIPIVEDLIKKANDDWWETQRENGGDIDEDATPPLPLIRLRVEHTPPEGGKFEIDNPQRFSARFNEKVANTSDVVQFHRKRAAATRTGKSKPDMPHDNVVEQLSLDSVKVEQLVKEFLTAQSLTILPQNPFSDAVGQFVDKDDKHAMNQFVEDSLSDQVKQLLAGGEDDFDEDAIAEMMEQIKMSVETAFEKGELRKSKRKPRKPKPAEWDTDEDGNWEGNPASFVNADASNSINLDEDEFDEDTEPAPAKKTTARGGGGARGGKAAAGATRKPAAATKKAPAKSTATSKYKRKDATPPSSEEEEDDDVLMLDDDDDDESQSQSLFVRPSAAKKAPASKSTAKAAPAKSSTRGSKAAPAPTTRGKQQTLSFAGSQAASQTGTGTRGRGGKAKAAPPTRGRKAVEPSDDEISDDEAFEPPATGRGFGRR